MADLTDIDAPRVILPYVPPTAATARRAEMARTRLRLAGSGTPTVMHPKRGDRAAYWLSCTNPARHRALKTLVAALFRLTDRFLGTVPSMNLDVVIRKG